MKEMTHEILKPIYENGLIWLLIGECISADTNMTNDERLKNIGRLSEIAKLLISDDCNYMSDEDKKKLIEMSVSSINMLYREMIDQQTENK